MIVEVCAASLDSALTAQRAGADRIELCSELGVGGITPSAGLFKLVKEQTSLPVHVLIRPRSGDFTYTQSEFDVILAGAGDQKIKVIKEVRAITSLGLKEAKELVEGAPQPVKEAVTKEEAEEIKAKIEGVGGSVEIK